MINFFSFFTDIFHYEFMQHALAGGLMAAILSGIVGYFVLIRNLSFATHALGHIGFTGATGALLFGLSPLTGQFILTLLAALGMGSIGKSIYKNDMAIGIILSFCLGLGTLFLYFYHGFAGQAAVILFGNLLSISVPDLKIMFGLTFISLLILGFITRPLLFASLEPELAHAKGLSLRIFSIIFIVILATAVTLASQVVGIILVFTLLIGPAAIALEWTHHFWHGLSLSVLLAVSMVGLSLILSYCSDWPISFWITALTFSSYMLTLALKLDR